MGASRWQVDHQKAKNLTSAGFPAARFTVVGSVAACPLRSVGVGSEGTLSSVAGGSVLRTSGAGVSVAACVTIGGVLVGGGSVGGAAGPQADKSAASTNKVARAAAMVVLTSSSSLKPSQAAGMLWRAYHAVRTRRLMG